MKLEMIAVVEGVIILILLVLIFLRKIGRPLSEIEIQLKEQRRASRLKEKQDEENRKYEELEKLEMVAKSLVYPITILSYHYDRDVIYYAHFKDSKGVMLNVEELMFNIYKKDPCPTVYALVHSCVNKKDGDKIN